MLTKREKSPALKRKREDDNNRNESAPPSWEILSLISHYMEPETLGIASCVSTTWSKCFSSENLWKSKLIKHYPSLFYISMTTNPDLSYKRLFSVFAEPDAKRNRKNQLAKPNISLSDLMFILHVSTGSKTATFVKQGKDLILGKIEFDLISNSVASFTKDMIMKEAKLKLQVVYKNFEKVLTINGDIVRSLNTTYGWFAGVLPAQENCFSRWIGGYIKPRFNDDNILDNFSFSIFNFTRPHFDQPMVHDTLKYFQSFSW